VKKLLPPISSSVSFVGRGVLPPPLPRLSHKTEITNILLYILNFASIIKFKM
jgi:hypothetical protein